jgi:hypothetical protein
VSTVEGLRLVFLILGAIYGIGVLAYRAYIWRKVKSVDDGVCELRDQVRDPDPARRPDQPEPEFTRVPQDEAARGNDEVPFPGGQEPHDVNSWVSQLEGREL